MRLEDWKARMKHQGLLVAVSKEQPADKLVEAYEAGHRHFAESRPQKLLARYEALPKDIMWHMIGPLQRNKVRLISPFVHLIHSVDSLKLLEKIHEEGLLQNRRIRCLLQLHIAKNEPQKQGFSQEELQQVLQYETLNKLNYVQIEGFMGMASFSSKKAVRESEFSYLREQFDALAQGPKLPRVSMKHLSMGMSADYKEALCNGSNLLRIGTALFGARKTSA